MNEFVIMRVAVPAGTRLSGEVSAHGERLLSTAEVCRLLGIAHGTWRSYVARGRAPRPDVASSPRAPLWKLETVRQYQQNKKRRAWKLPK